MGTVSQGGSWLDGWLRGNGPGDADGLQALPTRICQQETALACHLAERARALRFAPDRLSLEVLAEWDRQNAHALAHETGCETTLAAAASPARRPGTLTATKLIRDLEETENLYPLYRQTGRLTSDMILRGRLDEFAASQRLASGVARSINISCRKE